MTEGKIKTTILLGNFKDKFNLIDKNLPSQDREKIIEEMLSYNQLYHRDSTSMATIDVLTKAYKNYKGSRLNYRKFLNLMLETLETNRHFGDKLLEILKNPTCNNDDLNHVCQFILNKLKTNEEFKNQFDFKIIYELNKQSPSIFEKVFVDFFVNEIKNTHTLADLDTIMLNLSKTFSTELLNVDYTRVLNDSIKTMLNKISTKELVSTIQRYSRRSYWDDDDYYPQSIKIDNFYEYIREILKGREHIPNKSQNKLIRLMSIHAGKKLSLREAQLLNNNLKKKKEKK